MAVIRPFVVADAVGVRSITKDDVVWGPDSENYLRWQAQQCCAIYVAEEAGAVVGYSAVTITSLERPTVPARARPQPNPPSRFPALLLGALFVAPEHRKSGTGGVLLRVAVGIAMKIRAAASCMFVVLDAHADATAFYEKHGFVRFRDGPRPLYALQLVDPA